MHFSINFLHTHSDSVEKIIGLAEKKEIKRKMFNLQLRPTFLKLGKANVKEMKN